MNNRTNCENPRQGEYYDYLVNHISNVQKAYKEILRPVVEKMYPDDLPYCDLSVAQHDASKYDNEEFNAYCNYFYPCDGFEKDSSAFDLAWLRHQHLNLHHWQHWVLMRDSGEKQPVDMPIEEIVNMLCDWHSFSAKDSESTAYNWYNENKDKMLLSDNTKELVEYFIQYMGDPLR